MPKHALKNIKDFLPLQHKKHFAINPHHVLKKNSNNVLRELKIRERHLREDLKLFSKRVYAVPKVKPFSFQAMNLLMKIVPEMQRIENTHYNQLVKLVNKAVLHFYKRKLPQNTEMISLSHENKMIMNTDPLPKHLSFEDLKFENEKTRKIIHDYKEKKFFLDLISQGRGILHMREMVEFLKPDLDRINPKLYAYYRLFENLAMISNIGLFVSPQRSQAINAPKPHGGSMVVQTNYEQQKASVRGQQINTGLHAKHKVALESPYFVALLQEASKAMTELMLSPGKGIEAKLTDKERQWLHSKTLGPLNELVGFTFGPAVERTLRIVFRKIKSKELPEFECYELLSTFKLNDLKEIYKNIVQANEKPRQREVIIEWLEHKLLLQKKKLGW